MSRSVVLQQPAVVQVPSGSAWFSPLDMAVDCRDYRFAYVLVEVFSIQSELETLPTVQVMTSPTLMEDLGAWTLVASGVPSGFGHTTLVIDCGQFTTSGVRPYPPRISGYLRLRVESADGGMLVNLRAVALLKEPARYMSREWLPPYQLSVVNGDPTVVMPQDLWLDCTPWDDLFVLVQWDGRLDEGAAMLATLLTASDLVLDVESRGSNDAVRELEAAILSSAGAGVMQWATLQGLTRPNDETGSPGPAGKAWLKFDLGGGTFGAGSVRAWILAKQDW